MMKQSLESSDLQLSDPLVGLASNPLVGPAGEPLAHSAATSTAEKELYLILYPQELEPEIIQTLEDCGVPGYSEFPKLTGRGQHHRRFDNTVWPGATGAVFTVVSPEQAEALVPPFRELNRVMKERSRGLHGLHLFRWHGQQVI
jgi:hypothetical protein